MYGVIITIIICATVLYWSNRYLQPYQKPEEQKLIQPDEQAEEAMPSFDKVIKEIYGRSDE